ncbi:hypothetical protein H3N91_004423 [Salmonella enterica]|nr:hypothetical protein [Salmonella enterica]EEA2274826.1 hypothetical protein [Salmonella enterica]EFV5118848.1 hypothetical protein [Salmonella enterica]EGB7060949.1 hypothetical protein [Salmonella enterica]
MNNNERNSLIPVIDREKSIKNKTTVRCRNRPDLYHQHYDSLQGKYITQDPIGLKGGLNPYTYPLDPVMNIDPKGLCIEDACILEGAAAYSLWQWLVVGSVGTAIVASDYNETKALNEKLQQSKANTESLTNCPTIPPEDPCDKKLDNRLLKKAEIFDPHQVKRDWMGDRSNITKFDLCGCKDGRVVIKIKEIGSSKNKDCKGDITSFTDYNWK